MLPLLDPRPALTTISYLICYSIMVSSLELIFLAGRGEFSKGGAWDWAILGPASYPKSRLIDSVAKSPNSFLALLIFRCSLVLAMCATGLSGIAAALLFFFLVFTQIVLNIRILWGDDGSDQMTTVVLITLCIYCATGYRADVGRICALFIAGQLTLSYCAAGLAKLSGVEWRRGIALRNIMGHYTYGNRTFFRTLERFPMIGRLLSYSAIAFMATFPVYFLLPSPWAFLYLVFGLGFHIGVAATMRLNGFLTAFGSGYPALVFSYALIHPLFFSRI